MKVALALEGLKMVIYESIDISYNEMCDLKDL